MITLTTIALIALCAAALFLGVYILPFLVGIQVFSWMIDSDKIGIDSIFGGIVSGVVTYFALKFIFNRIRSRTLLRVFVAVIVLPVVWSGYTGALDILHNTLPSPILRQVIALPIGVLCGFLALVRLSAIYLPRRFKDRTAGRSQETQEAEFVDPMQITAIKGIVAGIVNTLVALSAGTKLPTLAVVLGAGIVGFFSYGLSLILFVLALRHLGTARTSAYFSTAPFVGAVLSVIIFSEPITLQLVGAAILMGIGVWLHVSERHEHPHRHEFIEHDHAHLHDDHHRHEHLAGEPSGEPHSHRHKHATMVHHHPHYPDLHHRHSH